MKTALKKSFVLIGISLVFCFDGLGRTKNMGLG